MSPTLYEQFARLFFDLIGSAVMMFVAALYESLFGALQDALLGP